MTLTEYASLVKRPTGEFLDTHSRFFISAHQRPLYRCGSAILWQEGGVNVDCAERVESREEGRGDEVAE